MKSTRKIHYKSMMLLIHASFNSTLYFIYVVGSDNQHDHVATLMSRTLMHSVT